METFGHYELVSRLATGGMAQVYLARDHSAEGAGRLVVVKRILPHLVENVEFVKMFFREAKLAARLHHPNISQVIDLGRVGDSYFMAMEYVHGEDVRRVVRKAAGEGRALPIPLACRLIIGAAEGLHYAHTKIDESTGKPLGIVHRDVSPQNILVTFEGRVKVIDFGIAKAADSANHTRTGVLKGKYSYMSPEQADGASLDQRSDVFALGIVLYELITQTRLFRRQSDLATLQAVVACKVARPSEVAPSVDPELEGIVLRALARKREERTPSCGRLAEELEGYLSSHRLEGSTSHLRQFMREIYSDRLAEELRLGLPPGEPPATAAPVEHFEIEEAGESDEEPTPASPLVPPARSERSSIALAQMPARRLPPPPAPPLSSGLEQGGAARRERAMRQVHSQRLLKTAAFLVLLGLLVAAATVYFSPGTLGRDGRLARLDLRSTPPGALIYVDGIGTGRSTPAELSLTPGEPHEVRLEKEGHQPLSLSLPPFSTELAREVRLEPLPVGALRIESTPPGATVLLGGRALSEKTPVLVSDLDASRPHEIVLSLEGHTDDISQQTLAPGQLTTVRRTLQKKRSGRVAAPTPASSETPAPAPATLSLTTKPAGVGIRIGAKDWGLTPLELSLPPGKHTVRFVDPKRGIDQSASVTLQPGGSETLSRDFTPRTVRFNVRPYAKIYIGDVPFAESPGDAQLVPGTYRVTYSYPELKARRTETLVVPPGDEPLKVQFTLTAGEGYASP